MSSISAIPLYIVGVACLGLGINSFLRPSHEYPRFGLPFEAPTPVPTHHDNGKIQQRLDIISPLIYLKGIRESTYGLALIMLQCQGQDKAITTLLLVMSLAGLGDGFVVWNHGGDQLRWKAIGHWITFVGLAGWSWWRVTSST